MLLGTAGTPGIAGQVTQVSGCGAGGIGPITMSNDPGSVGSNSDARRLTSGTGYRWNRLTTGCTPRTRKVATPEALVYARPVDPHPPLVPRTSVPAPADTSSCRPTTFSPSA